MFTDFNKKVISQLKEEALAHPIEIKRNIVSIIPFGGKLLQYSPDKEILIKHSSYNFWKLTCKIQCQERKLETLFNDYKLIIELANFDFPLINIKLLGIFDKKLNLYQKNGIFYSVIKVNDIPAANKEFKAEILQVERWIPELIYEL